MKYYFESKASERCYPKSEFKDHLREMGLDEMVVIVAVPHKVEGHFFCNSYFEIGSKADGGCGSICPQYEPRNGKSGCCKHYSTTFYEASDKEVTINLA